MPSRTRSYALLLVSLSIPLGGILAYSASCIRACAWIGMTPPLWRAIAMRISSYSALWQRACGILSTIPESAYAHEVVKNVPHVSG